MTEAPTRARLRIREIGSADDAAFDAAYALLRREFSRSELLPRRDWVQLLEEREQALWTDLNWHMLVAQRGDRVLAVASGTYVGNLNTGVIGYVAVAASARAEGLGPRLRRRLLRAFERDAKQLRGRPLKAVIGEVHADNPWLRHLVRREGAIALDFDYYQPSLRTRRKPVPLILYYQPLDRPRKWLTSNELRKLLYALWRRPYRVARPLSRPAFRRMMRELSKRRRIGARSLESPPRRAPKRSSGRGLSADERTKTRGRSGE